MIGISEIMQKLHLADLNKMQDEAIKKILNSEEDVIILSPTGSGKTLAYLLPLSQMIDTSLSSVSAVIIVPGRELALQSATVCSNMKCSVRALALYGGRPTMEEHRQIKEIKPHIVFCTPGRFNDHLDKGNIVPDAIKTVVIDEFDKCLEMGFKNEMQRLLASLSPSVRRILLSATDSPFIYQFIKSRHPQRINYSPQEKTQDERVSINIVRSPEKDKIKILVDLLRSLKDKSSIVFLNYRDSVERVSQALKDVGFVVSTFHGGLQQEQREAALYQFSNASANILVATDLASRGLDIPEIDNIIHYHLPLDESSYVHRVGRSTRWTAKGKTFFILSEQEAIPEYVEADHFDYSIPINLPSPMLPRMETIYIGKGKKDKLSKGDIVGFLCKKGHLDAQDIGRIDVKDRYTYVAVQRKRTAEMLKSIQGEKIKGMKTIVERIK